MTGRQSPPQNPTLSPLTQHEPTLLLVLQFVQVFAPGTLTTEPCWFPSGTLDGVKGLRYERAADCRTKTKSDRFLCISPVAAGHAETLNACEADVRPTTVGRP